MRTAKRKRCLSNEMDFANLKNMDNGYMSSLESSASKKSKSDLKRSNYSNKLSDISNYFESKEKLDSEQIDIVAAKKSSYFSLTPASSVTSLVDLNDDQQLDEPIKKVLTQTRSSKTRSSTTSKKRPRQQQKCLKSYLKEKENDSNMNRLQKCKLFADDTTLQQPVNKKTLTESDLLNDLNLFYKNYDLLKSKNNTCKQSPLPNLTWTDNLEFFECMRQSEIKYKKLSNYLNFHKSIEAQMRAILIDWLIEISHAYRLHRETLHLSIEYLDRFLSYSKVEMRVDRLQLIGLTSLYLAAKNEEIYPPKLSDFAAHMESYSDDNEDLMKKFEIAMLKTLEWKISPVTSNTWLQTYIQILTLNYKNLILGQKVDVVETLGTNFVTPVNLYKNSDKKLENFESDEMNFYIDVYLRGVTLVDLCLFDMESIKFDYSILSATALYYILDKYKLKNRDLIVEKVTAYNLSDLNECLKWMFVYYDVCKDLLFDRNLCKVKKFNSIDSNDWHNVQLYYEYLELLKEVECRKSLRKYYENNVMLTPPESHRKYPIGNRCGESSDTSSISSFNDF
ncbi:unnamed protein product [Brachionus calyciflorus]|uniref:Cyclin-like domain-containing protein n=1 Tax=Brachionus calyciflorus TaxID=104777 RepID=A0A813VEP5_9BILA|nr:unnamed protein product [Brachionus calyciflorus]